jgi:hypothetical protein
MSNPFEKEFNKDEKRREVVELSRRILKRILKELENVGWLESDFATIQKASEGGVLIRSDIASRIVAAIKENTSIKLEYHEDVPAKEKYSNSVIVLDKSMLQQAIKNALLQSHGSEFGIKLIMGFKGDNLNIEDLTKYHDKSTEMGKLFSSKDIKRSIDRSVEGSLQIDDISFLILKIPAMIAGSLLTDAELDRFDAEDFNDLEALKNNSVFRFYLPSGINSSKTL